MTQDICFNWLLYCFSFSNKVHDLCKQSTLTFRAFCEKTRRWEWTMRMDNGCVVFLWASIRASRVLTAAQRLSPAHKLANLWSTTLAHWHTLLRVGHLCFSAKLWTVVAWTDLNTVTLSNLGDQNWCVCVCECLRIGIRVCDVIYRTLWC